MGLKEVFLSEDFWDGDDEDAKNPWRENHYGEASPGNPMQQSNIDFRNNIASFIFQATENSNLAEKYREHVENLQTWLSSYKMMVEEYKKQYGDL